MLKKIKQIEDSGFTYTLMQSQDTGKKWVHINDTKTNEDAVLVPFDKIRELVR